MGDHQYNKSGQSGPSRRAPRPLRDQRQNNPKDRPFLMLNDPIGTYDSFREFRDPVASFAKLIATIEPRRQRATQAGHKPLSTISKGEGGNTLRQPCPLRTAQILCEVGATNMYFAGSTISQSISMARTVSSHALGGHVEDQILPFSVRMCRPHSTATSFARLSRPTVL